MSAVADLLARVVAHVCRGALCAASAIAPVDLPAPSAAQQLLQQERSQWREREMRLQARIAELEAELARLHEERLTREQEWFRFTRSLVRWVPAEAGAPRFPVDERLDREFAARAAAIEAEQRAANERGRQVLITLRSLLATESVEGLDLLECGIVTDGATGPVVARLLDEARRHVGTLTARRLRLEGSLAGHTLTLIFEDGEERSGGHVLPFARSSPLGPSEQRIVLPFVDPAPWMRDLPELFSAGAAEASSLPAERAGQDNFRLRRELNELLAADGALGFYRLRAFGGIRGDAWHDVHLEALDRQGKLERRIFADRMHLRLLESGVALELESGVIMRGAGKQPFLGGRHRVFLAGADPAAWRARELPGILDSTPVR